MSDVPVLLSCEQCKSRKTKCDKIFPQCSACRIANIDCRPVQRARLPRGRTSNSKRKKTYLTDKVARLENLVNQLETQLQDNDDATASGSHRVLAKTINAQSSTVRIESFIAKDFWLALSDEVSGLREMLESSSSEPAQIDGPRRQTSSESQTFRDLILNRGVESTDNAFTCLAPTMRAQLLQIYYDRVDILFKVTHWPTVLNFLRDSSSAEQSPKKDTAPRALEACICFMAACTLTEDDCAEMQVETRSQLIRDCQYAAEEYLSQTNLLVEPTFVALQAFTIYLMALRCHDNGAIVWSLLALAVRLAGALNLGSESDNTLSAVEIEKRRRLWFGIGLLDSLAAFGRASPPLLSHKELKYVPLNINDTEVGVRTVSNRPSTEMSVSCLTHQAMLCQRELCDVSAGATWQSRVDIVAKFEYFVNRTYANLEFSIDPLERYTALAAKDMTINMQLILRRPLHRNRDFTQQDAAPPSDDFNVLHAAVSVIERGLTKQLSTEFAKWSWFSWPRWYALAIVLVELCTIIDEDDSESSAANLEREEAYRIAQQSYANYAQSAADVGSGMLWKPIVKLMNRVQQLHGGGSRSVPSATNRSTFNHLSEHISRPPELDRHTILSRYHSALKVDSTELDTTFGSDMNMNIHWNSFLNELNHSDVSELALNSNPEFTSAWSLIPYLPMLPNGGVFN